MSEDKEPLSEDELAGIHAKALALMKDTSIQQASVAYMAGQRIVALSRMVMERTFDEEDVEESVRTHLVQALRGKAQQDLDLYALRTAVVDGLPPFLEDEISRLRSEKTTKQLLRNAGNQGFTVTLSGKKIPLPRGHMLVLFGSPKTVSRTMDTLCNEDMLHYEDGSAVEPESTLFLTTKMSHGDSVRGSIPLMEWQARATSPKNWASMEKVIDQRYHKKFSLMLIANGNMLGNFPPRNGKTLSHETRASLSLLRRILATSRQSAIVGIYENDQEPELTAEIEKSLKSHASVVMYNLYEQGTA